MYVDVGAGLRKFFYFIVFFFFWRDLDQPNK